MRAGFTPLAITSAAIAGYLVLDLGYSLGMGMFRGIKFEEVGLRSGAAKAPILGQNPLEKDKHSLCAFTSMLHLALLVQNPKGHASLLIKCCAVP